MCHGLMIGSVMCVRARWVLCLSTCFIIDDAWQECHACSPVEVEVRHFVQSPLPSPSFPSFKLPRVSPATLLWRSKGFRLPCCLTVIYAVQGWR